MRAIAMVAATVLTGSILSSAVAMTAVAAADTTPAVPSAEQLTAQLKQVLSTGAGDSERAAALGGGQAALPTANNIAAQLDRYSALMSWDVQNPTLNGNQLDAQLAVTVPVMGTRTHQIYWVAQGGQWKLSNASACVIAVQAAGTDCTV
jgi:hypothetical protein